MPAATELAAGAVFGNWTVVRRAPNSKDGRVRYICRCVCGVERDVNCKHMLAGRSTSCGCNGNGNKHNFAVGQRLGKLTLLSFTAHGQARTAKWECRCDCGNIVYLNRTNLTQRRSCGCVNATDRLIGKKFGRWTVIEVADSIGKKGERGWLCRCDCGTLGKRITNQLIHGRSTSCGCSKRTMVDVFGVKMSRPEFARLVGVPYVTLQARLGRHGLSVEDVLRVRGRRFVRPK